jgi:hypothetical protein
MDHALRDLFRARLKILLRVSFHRVIQSKAKNPGSFFPSRIRQRIKEPALSLAEG